MERGLTLEQLAEQTHLSKSALGSYEAGDFKDSRAEQLLMVFCWQTKLRYNKLTEEEKQWLLPVIQKSELAKSYVPQRGIRK